MGQNGSNGRIDAFPSFSFSLSMGEITDQRFREVSGLTTEQPAIEGVFCNEQGVLIVAKAPGLPKYQDITFKRPLVYGETSLAAWYSDVKTRQLTEPYTGSIVLHQGSQHIASWTFTGAWPIKYNISALNAGTNEAIHEELTIAVMDLYPDYAAG